MREWLQIENYYYVPDCNIIINKEIKDIFNKNINALKIKIDEINISEEFIKRNILNIKQITFETTQDCNLRCEYCVYSGSYDFQRKRNNVLMDFNTAKASLDFIFFLIKKRREKNIVISFYGGEPLLNFDLIEKVVNYIKELNSGFNLSFALTTNGTLLNEKNIDFFKKNDFSILVSLDGPSEIHDAKRKFPEGKGSFDVIHENLRKIANKHKEYYKNNINFSTVWSPDLSIKKIYNFFKEDDYVKNHSVRLTRVSQRKTDYFNKINYNKYESLEERNSLIELINRKIVLKEQLSPVDNAFNIDRTKFSQLRYKNFTYLFGACLFNFKIYIDVFGNFHICHQINNRFSFGNAHKGLDFKKMKEMTDNYIEVIKNHCYECKFVFLCEKCFVTFTKDVYFEIDREYCKKLKEIIPIRLRKYIQLQEKNLQL